MSNDAGATAVAAPAAPRVAVIVLTWNRVGIAMRVSFFSANAVLRAFGGQSHFVNGIVDGFSGRLRRDRITIRMPIVSNEPPDTPIIRLLRWLGA